MSGIEGKEKPAMEDIEGFISIKKIERKAYVRPVYKKSYMETVDLMFMSDIFGFILKLSLAIFAFYFILDGYQGIKDSFTREQKQALMTTFLGFIFWMQLIRK